MKCSPSCRIICQIEFSCLKANPSLLISVTFNLQKQIIIIKKTHTHTLNHLLISRAALLDAQSGCKLCCAIFFFLIGRFFSLHSKFMSALQAEVKGVGEIIERLWRHFQVVSCTVLLGCVWSE